MSGINKTPASPNFDLVDRAIQVGAQLHRVSKAVVAAGDVDQRELASRGQGPELSVADARLEALIGAITSRLGSAHFVGQTEAASAILAQLNAAHIEAAAGDSTIFMGIAALGKVERSLAALKKLGHVEGLPDLKQLIPEDYLAALRDRWYPAAKDQISKLLLDHAWRGLNLDTIRGLTELARSGDSAISTEASVALEPMLTRMLQQSGSLEVAGLLALFPPQVAVNQLAVLELLDKASSPSLQEALAAVVANMKPTAGVRSELRDEKWKSKPPEVWAAIIRARAHFGGTDIRAALEHQDPQVQAAGIDAITVQGIGSRGIYQRAIEAILERSTDAGSTNSVHPLVKAAAVRAVPAMMKDAASVPGNWETANYLLIQLGDVLAPFSPATTKPEPNALVRQAALETLLSLRAENTEANISNALLRAVDDPVLAGQALDGIRRVAYRDSFFMDLMSKKLDEVLARTPSPKNDWLKLELTQLYDLRGYHNFRFAQRGPMLTALSDKDPQIRTIAERKLLAAEHSWDDRDLKALTETILRSANAPTETKVVLAKLVAAGAKHFQPVIGREESPFPEIAALLGKVAKSKEVTAELAEIR